ncbi:MAG: TIR domain-containing protein [Chloroflexi bacterium]|nr:MAG: TIR domain-containing protein [Chloroflexota bacterium]
MKNETLELFYSYAPEDEALRKELDKHLTFLKREGLISDWHHKKISAGGHFVEEVDSHLQSARIILLLISPDFIASDYCYGTELQEAMKRSKEGTACVIPILLRPCDWQTPLFGDLQALPRDQRAITAWSNQDSAFTEIAKAIRDMIYALRQHPSSNMQLQMNAVKKQQRHRGKKVGESLTMGSGTPDSSTTLASSASLSATTLKKMIDRYYKELHEYQGKADYELAVRSAFQNLLAEAARLVKWTLIPEQTIESGLRPDGILRDNFDLRRGYWEAKGPKSDLEQEIKKKIAAGYPLTNTIFENTKWAILYQNKKRQFEYDLQNPHDVRALLRDFLAYTEPDIASFEAAVQEFKASIPELAKKLSEIIEQEHKLNKRFIAAFHKFTELCRTSLDPKISKETINEMLIQHLLTERIFRTVFQNTDFVNRNVIAAEIEKVIQALASRSFNRHEFLKSLDRFYVAIEAAAKGIESWSERQSFLNTVYERFFQGYAEKQADTHGIVYTPQEIVDFMCASVEEVLQKEFSTSISEPGVQILDPATGTGSFIVNLIHRIPPHQLKHKYHHDLFCNEIMLLPYYIASLNIEHEYYVKMGEYGPFEGICFADTLELAEGQQLPLFVEENTERVQREKEAQIMVVIGNPPYNAWQENENDNNKNRRYPSIDLRVSQTYAKDSKASNKNALSDAYVKFFRWAIDRLQGRDGLVCFISNNSFVDQIAFDGMRKHFVQDFTSIYHLDLHGNVRKNPRLSGTTHNVFGIQVGVGITIAVRLSQSSVKKLYYYRVPEDWRKAEKLAFLAEKKSLEGIEWQQLQVDEKYTWITNGMYSDFSKFLPLGTKEAKALKRHEATLFSLYSSGIKTNRDQWAYDYNHEKLTIKIQRFTDTYNSEVDRWKRRGNTTLKTDEFVTYDDTKIKWSEGLKLNLQRGIYANADEKKIRQCLYRPFCKLWLFFDRALTERVYQFPQIFPTPASEQENIVICLSAIGSSKLFHCLVNNCIADLHLTGDSQCFPYYTYAEDGSNRRENITDWALSRFQAKYSSSVTKWDIFHYVYAILHHPQYRERYAENLKRDLPHIPLVHDVEKFQCCVTLGRQLMSLHLNYEQEREYKLNWHFNKDIPFSWLVEKMKLTSDKTAVIVNESLTLAGIPQACFAYRLGNRSALEWVIDQYQVTTDKRSGIESDPNRLDDEQYIVRLIGRVVTVSLETVKLVNDLAQAVTVEDWLGESMYATSPSNKLL